jgi:nucleotide-binding universal stress UspA family protein
MPAASRGSDPAPMDIAGCHARGAVVDLDRPFGTIVAGCDGRPGGRDALRLADWLRRYGNGRIVAVRAFPYPVATPTMTPRNGARPGRPTQAALERELRDARISAAPEALGERSPARALHRVAVREHAGLIVVGTTDRGMLGRILAGDDTAATVRGAPCAVAVAPRGFDPERRTGPLRVGVLDDGGAAGLRARCLAATLARASGGDAAGVPIVERLERPAERSAGFDVLVTASQAPHFAGLACPVVFVP